MLASGILWMSPPPPCSLRYEFRVWFCKCLHEDFSCTAIANRNIQSNEKHKNFSKEKVFWDNYGTIKRGVRWGTKTHDMICVISSKCCEISSTMAPPFCFPCWSNDHFSCFQSTFLSHFFFSKRSASAASRCSSQREPRQAWSTEICLLCLLSDSPSLQNSGKGFLQNA